MSSHRNNIDSDENVQSPDMSGCAQVDGNEVPRRAKEMPKTFATKPDGEPTRAANRERRVWNSCAVCSLWYAARAARLERGENICCSRACWQKHVIASGMFKGENNPRWPGGVSNDNMRYRRRQMEREPEKEAARRAVQESLRAGKMQRQRCEQCDAEVAHAHHDDLDGGDGGSGLFGRNRLNHGANYSVQNSLTFCTDVIIVFSCSTPTPSR